MELAQQIVEASTQSGGPHTSRTMMLAELSNLLDATPAAAGVADLKAAVIDYNVLGKNTLSGRQRTYRYLRELYALDSSNLGFRALRDLWDVDPDARPLLALLSALARDPVLRATAQAVIDAPAGATVTADDLTAAVKAAYPDTYGDAIAAKIGRNTASTWTQSGHLVGRTHKVRARVQCRPAAVAYALLIGHTEGRRGEMLFDTLWCRVLDHPKDMLIEQAVRASQRGLLEFKHGGDVTEVSFGTLLRSVGEESGE